MTDLDHEIEELRAKLRADFAFTTSDLSGLSHEDMVAAYMNALEEHKNTIVDEVEFPPWVDRILMTIGGALVIVPVGLILLWLVGAFGGGGGSDGGVQAASAHAACVGFVEDELKAPIYCRVR